MSRSRQDWQGATDDEVNRAIENCSGDTDHDRSVKAALLWVMNAVDNPHPLEIK